MKKRWSLDARSKRHPVAPSNLTDLVSRERKKCSVEARIPGQTGHSPMGVAHPITPSTRREKW